MKSFVILRLDYILALKRDKQVTIIKTRNMICMGKIWYCNNTVEEWHCHGLNLPYLSSPDDSLVLNLLIGENVNLQTRHQPQPVNNYCNRFYRITVVSCSHILSAWLGGDIVDSGMGLSYRDRPTRLHRLAGRYDKSRQPYARVDYISQTGTKNLAFVQWFSHLCLLTSDETSKRRHHRVGLASWQENWSLDMGSEIRDG